MTDFKDNGPGTESGVHKGTNHICKITNSEASYDNKRFTSCPMCHFKPGDKEWKPVKK